MSILIIVILAFSSSSIMDYILGGLGPLASSIERIRKFSLMSASMMLRRAMQVLHPLQNLGITSLPSWISRFW